MMTTWLHLNDAWTTVHASVTGWGIRIELNATAPMWPAEKSFPRPRRETLNHYVWSYLQRVYGRGRQFAAAITSLAALLMVLFTVGCSASGSSVPGSGNAPDGAAPAFEGPWAAEFAQAYGQATSDLQRTILKDGTITEAEATQVRNDVVSCLEAAGYTNVSYGAEGLNYSSTSKMDPNAPDNEADRCLKDTEGPVLALYEQVRRNPSNEDEAELMAGCLTKSGLVPQGYTAADYRKDMESNTPSFDTESQKFRDCAADPRANMSGQP